MAAGNLFGRSAGMKNMRALLRLQARDFKFLESARRQRGDFAPVLYALGGNPARVTKLSIRRDVGELEGEQGQSQFVEAPFRPRVLTFADVLEQRLNEVFK